MIITCENYILVLISLLLLLLYHYFVDLSLFSTKTLVESNPDHQVEVRTQVNIIILTPQT